MTRKWKSFAKTQTKQKNFFMEKIMEAFFCREDRKLQVRCLSNHSYLKEKHTQSLQRNISTQYRLFEWWFDISFLSLVTRIMIRMFKRTHLPWYRVKAECLPTSNPPPWRLAFILHSFGLSHEIVEKSNPTLPQRGGWILRLSLQRPMYNKKNV